MFHNREEPCPRCKNPEVMNGKTERWEWHSRRKNKTYDLIETPLKNVDGTLLKLTIFRDITERKRAEEALRKSEEKYRTLYESSKDGIVFSDMEGNFLDANQTYLDMLGYTREEVKRLTYQQLTHEKWHEMEEDIVKNQIMVRGYSDEYEKEYIKKDGTVFPITIRVWLIKDEQGKPAGLWAIVRDITDRKQAEEQIKASLREKEILVRELHHRVKNNLQIISTLLYLQSGYIKDKEAFAMFKDSQNRIRSMALIHDKLYQFEDLGKIDIAEYIRELATDLFHSYGVEPDDIKLKINVHEVLLGVNTAIPIGLIINELVSNSLRHAFPDGKEGKIHIELLRSVNENTFTLIVCDNGVGFPKDLDFRKTETLGLQLVITLVEQLKGTIELDRSRGTEFKITFSEL